MHPGTAALLEYFDYDHLDTDLAAYSLHFHDLAHKVATELEGPEVTAGLRHLLEAKDCIVRAALTARKEGHGHNRST